MNAAVTTSSAGLQRIWSSTFVNETIVALLLLQMLCAGFKPLKILQMPSELVLLGILFCACMTFKYDRWQIALLIVTFFVTVGSFFTTDIALFLVNLKQNTLCVLALLYFSIVRFQSKLIFPAFVLTITLLLVNFVAPEILAPLIASSSFEEYNSSRFGGIFLNAHYNAFFMAVVLIYYGHRVRLYGVGALLVFATGSKVVFAAYIANLIAEWGPIRRWAQYPMVVAAVAVLGGYLIFLNLDAVLETLLTPELSSGAIILVQLFDPAYYKVLLNPFPGGNIDVSAEAKVVFEANDGYNEIGYFQLAMVSGIFLACLFLLLLLKYARPYRVFILIVLLHFGIVLTPLILYMLVTYSREMRLSRMHKHNAVRLQTDASLPFATSAARLR